MLGKYHQIDEFDDEKDDCAVVIGVNQKYNDEISKTLREKGFSNIYTVNDWHVAMECIKSAVAEHA